MPAGTAAPQVRQSGQRAASTQVQDNDSAAVLLTQPDGKILAIGSAQNTTTGVVDVALIRYLAS